MIPELALFALILACGIAIVLGLIPLGHRYFPCSLWGRLAPALSYGHGLLLLFSFLSLAYAFVKNDFSVAYVAQHSYSHLPAVFRFCAVWGAHEGSMLLWVVILGLWMMAVANKGRFLPKATLQQVLAVLAWISLGFLLFILMTSNPFVRTWPNVPLDGNDLNPLLQDVGLISHPPMLYMGYVGFAVAFAFAITGLIQGRLDKQWVEWTQPWTLMAWIFLTVGIVLGSWWSYRVLGWGGWWFWDPVENASFLPWLLGTALFHSLAVTAKRGAVKAWTVLLAIGTFSLSLLGTFLVRSGVLVSVHAFAVDPARGAYILKFLSVVIGGSLLLFAWRAPKLNQVTHYDLGSRESFMLVNNALLSVAMFTILLGTLYPMILDALHLGKVSVGPPYFNLLFVPVMAIMLFLMGLVPHSRWQRTSMCHLAQATKRWGLVSIIVGCSVPWLLWNKLVPAVSFAAVLVCWVITMTLSSVKQSNVIPTLVFKQRIHFSFTRWSMVVAHVGLVMVVLGVVVSTHLGAERDVRMSPGDTAIVGPYQFNFDKAYVMTGPNYSGYKAKFNVTQVGRDKIDHLVAQHRLFTVSRMPLALPGIKAGFLHDLYVALGENFEDGSWAVRLYYKPLVRWIWAGGLVMAIGGFCGVLAKRRKSLLNATVT